MKISKSTIEVLKNFATINQNILIRPGKQLTTRTVAKNLFASADVDTDFPQEFGIYNLSTFLGVLSLFSDPDVELGEKSMTISQGKYNVSYMFAAPEVLAYPDKMINMPKTDATFELSEENLKSLLKAGAVLASTDLKISGNGSTISCTALDPKNPSANTFTVEVGETDRTFDAFIKLEHLKMPAGKYTVTLSDKKIAQFSNSDIKYSLYVANEKNTVWS
jgi:hypothetical protein